MGKGKEEDHSNRVDEGRPRGMGNGKGENYTIWVDCVDEGVWERAQEKTIPFG